MIFSFIKRVSKSTVRTVADVPAWLGLSYLKESTRAIVKVVKPMYETKAAPGEPKLNFEEAVEKYHLTEADLQHGVKNMQWQSYLFATLAVCSFLYMLYLLLDGHFFATVMALGITVLLAVKCWICRLWIFKIQQRKLGCSISEWLQKRNEG